MLMLLKVTYGNWGFVSKQNSDQLNNNNNEKSERDNCIEMASINVDDRDRVSLVSGPCNDKDNEAHQLKMKRNGIKKAFF